MRVSLVALVLLAACGVARADDAPEPATEQEGVTVNMGALTEEPAAPAPDKPNPKSLVRPMAKPSLASRASVVPMPRHKPVTEITAAPAVAAAIAPPPVVAVPAKAEVPVTIVENFPVEMSGAASDPFASRKPIDPVAGFAVLSRIHFSKGLTRMPNGAYPILDAVAVRLLASQERVRLAAFSGKTGDMSSESRRLSLERARVVREYLVSKGVPVDRVDVLPFGGAVDGIIDRVDVLASGT